MHKFVAAVLAAGALLAPAAALAAPPILGHHHARNVARQQCNAERKLLGVKAFRLKYGGPPTAYAACVRSHLPSDLQAAGECRTQRQRIGVRAFRLLYGGPVPLNRCIKELTTP